MSRDFSRLWAGLLIALGLAAAQGLAFELPEPGAGTVPAAEWAAVWGVNPAALGSHFTISRGLKVTLIASSVPANVLWPGEAATFTWQFVNQTDQPISAAGRAVVLRYALYTHPGGDVFKTGVRKLADCGSVPLAIAVPAQGYEDVTVTPPIPPACGGYAVLLDLPGYDRLFGAGCVRTFRPPVEQAAVNRLTVDNRNVDLLTRLGVTVNRVGVSFKPTSARDFETWFAEQGKYLAQLQAVGKPTCLEFGVGAPNGPTQPLGLPRWHLTSEGVMLGGKADWTWLPQYDGEFKALVKRFAVTWGWPHGPVTAMKFMNEPWNGLSISGWGADDLRYREIYTALCEAVEEARQEAGVQILLGGCDSSSNTFDKLFPDGKDTFLPRLDFMSIHYQGMNPATTVKMFVNRQSPRGRVQVWDTESWVANSDDRVAAVLSTMLAMGLDRIVGVDGRVLTSDTSGAWEEVRTAQGKERRVVTHAWPVAAALGACQHFLGARPFREILFPHGLPWVYRFDGLTGEEDSTLVVVGDLGPTFGRDNLLFRTVRGQAEAAHKQALRNQLAALPADSPRRADLEARLQAPETLSGARMVIAAAGDRYALYDFYGNPVPAQGGEIIVPLNDRGYYLRGAGGRGSWARLLAAVRAARIEGYEPVEAVVHDPTAPLGKGAAVRLELTNILNRPVSGVLSVAVGGLTGPAPQVLRLLPYETKMITAPLEGPPNAANSYPLRLTFDAGADGRTGHEEDIHVNYVARRTITVDGNLDDWQGVLPQPVVSQGLQQPTPTEAAWLPFKTFASSYTQGLATGYLAYDADYFYFAAKVADSTPEEGMPRFATRDEDADFYPETSYKTDGGAALHWPEGVRRYSYRRYPELPMGSSPNHDNVQLAFNVLPEADKPWYPGPPGTMAKFTGYWDSDYEYALNPVAPAYGGGTEIWPIRRPDLPNKHYYPHSLPAPGEGPVTGGKLVCTRNGNTRVVECALPWSEIPGVKRALEVGRPIKFTFRVNDNAGVGCLELARGRSVSKHNWNTFKPDWIEHWANEVEFGWEK